MPELPSHPVVRPITSAQASQYAVAARSSILFGSEGLRAGWGMALYFLLFGLSVAAELPLLRRVGAIPAAGAHGVSPRMTFWNDALACLSVLLITLLLAKIERRPVTSYGLASSRKLPHFFAGLLWGILALSLLVLLLAKLGYLRFDAQLLAGSAALRYGAAWAGCFVLVALFEENLLRGYLQFTLARGVSVIYRSIVKTPHSDALGFWTAAALLSVLFGAAHRGNAGESPLGLVSATAAGLVFCLSLWRTGALWWAIGFHAAWDWAQSFLYGVADSGNVAAGRLVATHPVGRRILSGGLTGPEGSVFVLPVLAVIATIIVLTLRQAPRMRQDHFSEETAIVS